MNKRQQPIWIFIGLVIIAIMSIAIDTSGLLRTQLLAAPERIEPVKLIRQNADPVQFDIYYQGLKDQQPSSVEITMVNTILDLGGQFRSRSAIIETLLLATGSQEIISGPNSQTLTIRNIVPQNTTKLGTIITNVPLQEYVSLEYDIVVNNQRSTLIDNPVPVDFPFGYTGFQNPTGEPMYIAVPDFHALLAPIEKVYIKYPAVRQGAVLLANTVTTLQSLDQLNQTNLITQNINPNPPSLVVEQNQIILPRIPSQDLNTLLVRYRNENSDWSYSTFLLPASTDITLPVAVRDLLDFYNEVEYSFAYLSNALPTVNLEFPYNSLLAPNQFPVFYRTDFVSLVPELVNNRAGLEFNLNVSTASDPNGLYIGLLTRDPIFSMQDALHFLEQQLPIVVFDNDSDEFKTVVNSAQQLPHFNLIGRHDQIWSKQAKKQNLEFISASFEPIKLVPDDIQIPELEVVSEVAGDKLLCFAKSEAGSFSLPTIGADVMLTSNCLQSARRAGLKRGIIYPVVYRAETKTLEGLKHFRFDENLGELAPQIENYNPFEKTLTLNAVFDTADIKVIVSPKPDFSTFTTLTMENLGKANFSVPLLPGCNVLCYIKAVATIKETSEVVLGYPTETLLFSPVQEPLLQLCFANQDLVENLYDPQELKFQVLKSGEAPVDLTFQRDSKCYELAFGDRPEEVPDSSDTSSSQPVTQPAPANQPSTTPAAPATTPDPAAPTAPAAPAQPTTFVPRALAQNGATNTLKSLAFISPDLPDNTIVVHTNGLTTSHIEIPPQRHYLFIDTDSEQQLILTDLVFEHAHLRTDEQPILDPVLQQSYQLSQWSNRTTFFSTNRGNVILNQLGQIPYFLERFTSPSPVNESLLFPSGGHILEIPHTIRLIPPEQIVLLGFSEGNNRAELNLDIPERSQVKLFLDDIFRPNIQQSIPLAGGITFNTDSGFLSLENPTGVITIPVQLSLNKTTDPAIYQNTFPPTEVPDEIDIAFLDSTLVMHINQPTDIPSSTVLDPVVLERGALGFEYEDELSLGGVENSRSFEVLGGRFLSSSCDEIFNFDLDDRKISGQIPVSSTLAGCFFQLPVRYLVRNDFAEMEISTLFTYLIPILESADQSEVEPEVIRIPIIKEDAEVNEVINVVKSIEELVETTPQFLSKQNTASLISSIGDLLIVFDEANQQFIISGTSEALTEQTSRYVRAIRQATGELALFELQFIPVEREEIVVPVTQSFPNLINVPQILFDQGFTPEELATLKIEADTLPTTVEISEDGIVNLFALPELNDQVFFALIEQEIKTPSPFVEFEQRLEGAAEEKKPTTLRIDLRLQVSEAPTVTFEALQLRPDKLVTLDLSRFGYNPGSLITGQLPDFLKRVGNQLAGQTPAEAMEVNLLIQDFLNIRNIIVPLIIGDVTTSETPDETTDEPDGTLEADEAAANRGASDSSDNCFPDIANQDLAYREAICIANRFRIISGSGGFFRPGDNINRAEVSKVLVTGPLVILGLLTDSEIPLLNDAFPTQSFIDVPQLAWFFGFVETVLEVGIFDGYPDRTFRPSDPMNRAEAAKVIVNTLQQLRPNSFGANESIAANTVRGDQWFAPYVRILNNNGGDLPEVNESGALSEPISRAQFVYNLLILLDSKADAISAGL